jgi:membrane protease subunit HflK
VLKSSQGESERFSKLLTEYKRAPGVTRERLYIETLEQIMSNNPKVVLDVQNGNNLTYLPLDRIISKDKSSGSKSLGISNSSGTESGSSLGSALDEFRRNAARSRMRETR